MIALPTPAAHAVPTSACSSLRFVRTTADLAAIFDPGVNVVTLQRTPVLALAEEAQRALTERGFRRILSVTHRDATSQIREALLDFPRIAAELAFWTDVLFDLTDCDDVGIRLSRVEAAMCPRFHVDRVTLRVVSTFVGRATEFVSNEHFDRRQLGRAGIETADEMGRHLHMTGAIRAAESFDVVLLKGESWPNNAGKGAVHRSPAASSSSPRLIMTLDPI